jgi:PTS system mannose-specific IID component
MQNIGFTMAMIPAIRQWNLPQKDTQAMLGRHLQMFNTHPYFTGPVLGSVIHLEEQAKGSESSDSIAVKQSLMGPYAAIGDTFFWGALRPFAAIVACVLAYNGYIIAPLAFLFLYTPAHIWVRLKGFLEGYQRGKQGIEFVRAMDLPSVALKIRWLSLIILAVSTAFWLAAQSVFLSFIISSELLLIMTVLATVLTCLLLIKKRISQFYILYGAAIFFLLISWKVF